MSSEMNASKNSVCPSQDHSCLPSFPQFSLYLKGENAASHGGGNSKLQKKICTFWLKHTFRNQEDICISDDVSRSVKYKIG